MRPSQTTTSGVSTSAAIPVDIYCPSSDKGVFVVVTGTVTYTVQITGDDIFDSNITPTWVSVDATANANLIAATTTQQGTIDTPCRAIRVNQTAGAGSTRVTVIQQSLA